MLAERSHLDWLESEAIYILREVAGQCQNPVLFFSGGKDSIVLLRLAEKAFRPGRFPFPLLHIDTGHNYAEVIEFRDRRAAELGERLLVRSVEDSIRRGTVRLTSENQSRNAAQFHNDGDRGTICSRQDPCYAAACCPPAVQAVPHAGYPRRSRRFLAPANLWPLRFCHHRSSACKTV